MNSALKHLKTRNSDEPAGRDDTHPSNSNINDSTLLPGLPNHLAQLCLQTLHPSLLYLVCRSWRSFIFSPPFPPFFSLYTLLSPTQQNTHQKNQSNSLEFFSLDLISSKWRPLPPPPRDPPLCLLRRHPSFISRTLPIQSLTVSGHLILIAATTHQLLPALPRPIVFNPLSKKWFFGPSLSAPRRWCAVGVARGVVYMASGVGACYNADVARSVEKWDLNNNNNNEWKWEKKANLKDGRFSREAIEILGFGGKLWMVNVKGSALKQGAVYDVQRDKWEEMPEKVAAAWKGPAATAVDKESVVYVVDEKKGGLRKYDCESECWEVVIESSEILKGAEQMAAGGGRVCIVCAGGGQIAVVDVVAQPARMWVVSPTPGMEVVAVHILPRMCWPE